MHAAAGQPPSNVWRIYATDGNAPAKARWWPFDLLAVFPQAWTNGEATGPITVNGVVYSRSAVIAAAARSVARS
jgi:hypothetical protein